MRSGDVKEFLFFSHLLFKDVSGDIHTAYSLPSSSSFSNHSYSSFIFASSIAFQRTIYLAFLATA
jgi:hypothetical protein